MKTDKQINLEEIVPEQEVWFDRAEFANRRQEIQRKMQASDIDVLYLTAPESRFYVDGFNSDWYQAQSPKEWHALSGVAVHAERDELITFERQVNVVLVKLTSIAEETRILGDSDGRNMMEFIRDCLRDVGWLPGRVGLERYSYRPNPAVSAMLQASLEEAGCVVVDASDVLRDVRRRKSPRELEYIRQAAKIGDAGMRRASEVIRAGVTELDVYADIVHAMVKAGGEHSGKAVSCASGPKTMTTDAQTSRRVIQSGEIVNIDICGCYNRYHTNYARTFSVGEPDPEVATRVNLSAGASKLLAATIRPHIPINTLTSTMQGYYEDAGIWEERWWVGGYEMGIAFAPEWVGPRVYDPGVDEGDRCFEPGDVFNYESDFFLPRKSGLSLIIDTMAFYDSHAEILHSFPQELCVVG